MMPWICLPVFIPTHTPNSAQHNPGDGCGNQTYFQGGNARHLTVCACAREHRKHEHGADRKADEEPDSTEDVCESARLPKRDPAPANPGRSCGDQTDYSRPKQGGPQDGARFGEEADAKTSPAPAELAMRGDPFSPCPAEHGLGHMPRCIVLRIAQPVEEIAPRLSAWHNIPRHAP